jgi:hypothetical protein
MAHGVGRRKASKSGHSMPASTSTGARVRLEGEHALEPAQVEDGAARAELLSAHGVSAAGGDNRPAFANEADEVIERSGVDETGGPRAIELRVGIVQRCGAAGAERGCFHAAMTARARLASVN